MPLVDGDLAPPGDVWYRILTHKDYITRGRVQHAAFRGKCIREPLADENRPWNAELSGRLRSLSGTIEQVHQSAIAYSAAMNRTFCGLMFQKDVLQGQMVENIELGVWFTPLDTDQTHSDLTFSGPVPFAERSEEHDRFIMALSKKFHALHPEQIELLPNADVAPAIDD